MRNILKAATLESKFPIHARHMNKGSQGTAELYDSTPPGLVSERKLQGRHAERRDEFFGPFFRTSF